MGKALVRARKVSEVAREARSLGRTELETRKEKESQ